MSQIRKTKELVICSLFAALVAVGAFIKISIPIEPFPMHFTLQLFFALLAGFLLGPKMGFFSVSVYLILGLIGVPIFAAGGGLSYLLRPTFGFLLGFAFAAWLTGWVLKKCVRQGFLQMLLASTLGMMAYYLSGVLYFYVISNFVINMPVTWPVVLVNCFLITLVPDFILCLLAALLARRLWPEIRRILAT